MDKVRFTSGILLRSKVTLPKMAAPMVERGEDAFRTLFKFYRRKHPPPDLSNFLDFSKGIVCDKVRDNIEYGEVFM